MSDTKPPGDHKVLPCTGLPAHVSCLVDTKQPLSTVGGKAVQVLELQPPVDNKVLPAWAKHFRSQYCDDSQIDALRSGMNLSRAEYLRRIKFPDPTEPPGPSIRSGDFGETIVADYVEFVLKYWLPRNRYDRKTVRNESTKGTDIIGFKIVDSGRNDPTDALGLFEVKAKLTGSRPDGRLQDAVDGSAKDELRKAESLNAIKQRLLDIGNVLGASTVERFQDPEDRPHQEEYGAVALVSTTLFDVEDITSTSVASHPHAANLTLIVIHGPNLMNLVHELYRRAADEA